MFLGQTSKHIILEEYIFFLINLFFSWSFSSKTQSVKKDTMILCFLISTKFIYFCNIYPLGYINIVIIKIWVKLQKVVSLFYCTLLMKCLPNPRILLAETLLIKYFISLYFNVYLNLDFSV